MQNLKSNSSGAREVTPKVLDLLAWPFRYLNDDDVSEEGSDVEEEDAEERKTSVPPVDSDELTIAEKQTVSMRLFALVRSPLAC